MTGGVNMTAGDMSNRVHDRDHGDPEGEGDAEDADAESGQDGAQECAPATGKHQKECAQRFGGEALSHRGSSPCGFRSALCRGTRQSAAGEGRTTDRRRALWLGGQHQIEQRLLRAHGWLERSGWIYDIWKGAGCSILAFEFFYDILLQLRGFLNSIFALQRSQFS